MIDVTPFAQTLKGKPVAVFGLGLSNRAAIEALVAADVKIWAHDDDPDRLSAAQKIGAEIRDLSREDLSSCSCLVLAPGVKPSHPVVKRAREAGIEIICDIEILHRCHHGRRVVGITGTNGKSTTTALIGHILKTNNMPASVGGNIGHAVLALEMPPPGGIFVLELSSYQLDLCPSFAPDIAVLLNITPDHLDHHGSMENYIAAKTNILRGTGPVIITGDDAPSKILREKFDKRTNGIPDKTLAFDNPALRGEHNRQNAAAAIFVCRALGLDDTKINEALRTFPGLPHRQYAVRTIGAVTYINDSKATNAESAARALACYDNIYWIVGGQPKDGGLHGLETFMKRVHHAFTIGAAAAEFGVWLEAHKVPFEDCGTMERAVAAAHAQAQADGKPATVLLSPACASFDQFKNFEHRGAMFTTLINALENKS